MKPKILLDLLLKKILFINLFNNSSIKQDKIHLFLDVTKNDVLYYKFNKRSANTRIFFYFIDNIEKKYLI